MNVSAIASSSQTAISAGSVAPKAASGKESVSSQSSTVVSLSTGQPVEPLTYMPGTGLSSLTRSLLLPTRANVAMLASQAGDAINAKLDAAGIPREPGFELAFDDVNSAHVTVKGSRSDAKAIEDLVNGDKELQMTIHNAYALASHIPAIDRAVKFQQEYAAAKTQAEIDAVIGRYSDMFSGHTPAADIGLSFGNDGLQVSINGETAQA